MTTYHYIRRAASGLVTSLGKRSMRVAARHSSVSRRLIAARLRLSLAYAILWIASAGWLVKGASGGYRAWFFQRSALRATRFACLSGHAMAREARYTRETRRL